MYLVVPLQYVASKVKFGAYGCGEVLMSRRTFGPVVCASLPRLRLLPFAAVKVVPVAY